MKAVAHSKVRFRPLRATQKRAGSRNLSYCFASLRVFRSIPDFEKRGDRFRELVKALLADKDVS